MTYKSNIEASIEGHTARNRELLDVLREQGVNLGETREIDHHFWASSQTNAALLAKACYERGYLVQFVGPVEDENSSESWSVEARIERTPAEAASAGLTEELVRLAAEFESTYDGWGTEV